LSTQESHPDNFGILQNKIKEFSGEGRKLCMDAIRDEGVGKKVPFKSRRTLNARVRLEPASDAGGRGLAATVV
jgi:hypothetical protein